MTLWRSLVFATAPILAIAACGGSTSDGSGGTSSGGGGSGGNGGCGGGGAADCIDPCTGAYSSPVCENESWVCKYSSCADSGQGGCAAGGGMDCFDPCTGDLYGPNCVDGGWVCNPSPPCPDAGPDGAQCLANEVPTVDGCLTCNAATSAYTNAIDAARTTNASCGTASECMLTSASTACSGSCQVAVSVSGEAAFQAALQKIDADYCSGFVAVCGYSTPKCAVPTLACNAGSCEAVFN